MRRIVLALLIAISSMYAQVDTLRQLSYFPLSIGNRWQYEVTLDDFGYDTTYQLTISVVGDTVLPNGISYYFLENSLGFHYTSFFRIDTTSLSVMNYYPYSSCWNPDTTCADSEIAVFDLHPPPYVHYPEEYSTCCYTVEQMRGMFQIDIVPDSVGWMNFSWFDGFEHNFVLVEKIGIYYQRIWEIAGATGYLTGALIDGVQYGDLSTGEEIFPVPSGFYLVQPYPNPFNPTTTVEFSVPRSGLITLTVYDLLGREVETILNQQMNPGRHKVKWNAGEVPSGIYIVRMRSGDPSQRSGQGFTQTRKVTVLR